MSSRALLHVSGSIFQSLRVATATTRRMLRSSADQRPPHLSLLLHGLALNSFQPPQRVLVASVTP